MSYTICFDTICDGYTAVIDEFGDPLEFESYDEAEAELDSDFEFYQDCFVCHVDEIGHKTIFMSQNYQYYK